MYLNQLVKLQIVSLCGQRFCLRSSVVDSENLHFQQVSWWCSPVWGPLFKRRRSRKRFRLWCLSWDVRSVLEVWLMGMVLSTQGGDGERRHPGGGQHFGVSRALGTRWMVRSEAQDAGWPDLKGLGCWVQSLDSEQWSHQRVFRKVAWLDLFLRKEIVYHLKREPEAGEATRKLLQWSRRWTVRAFTDGYWGEEVGENEEDEEDLWGSRIHHD